MYRVRLIGNGSMALGRGKLTPKLTPSAFWLQVRKGRTFQKIRDCIRHADFVNRYANRKAMLGMVSNGALRWCDLTKHLYQGQASILF